MKYIVCILCALFPLYTMGQSAYINEAPDWIRGGSKTLKYSTIDVFSGVGYNEEEAWSNAVKKVIQSQSLGTGTEATVSLDMETGDISVASSHAVIVKAKIRDHYYEPTSNGYKKVFLLVQTAKNPAYSLEPVTVTENYPFSPMVFVPGMSQIHKKSIVKGSLIIASEIAAIAGIVAFESLRSSYDRQIRQTHDTDIKKQYIAKATTMSNIRNGCIAGAAAIYAWNIIDGIVAKGKKHIVIGETEIAMNIMPYSFPQYSGVALCFNF